jgi:hypothetical protein
MAEPLKAIEADAKAEPEGVVVTLVTDDGTVDVLIPPPAMWFEGAVEALTQGKVSEWVHLAVEDEKVLPRGTPSASGTGTCRRSSRSGPG